MQIVNMTRETIYVRHGTPTVSPPTGRFARWLWNRGRMRRPGYTVAVEPGGFFETTLYVGPNEVVCNGPIESIVIR